MPSSRRNGEPVGQTLSVGGDSPGRDQAIRPLSSNSLSLPLARRGLSEQIVEALQRAIITGTYKPGDWLIQIILPET